MPAAPSGVISVCDSFDKVLFLFTWEGRGREQGLHKGKVTRDDMLEWSDAAFFCTYVCVFEQDATIFTERQSQMLNA